MHKDHRIHAALYGGQGFHNVELINVNTHLEKVGQCFSSSLFVISLDMQSLQSILV